MTFREYACQKCIQAFKGFESILEKAYLASQFISDFFIEIHFKHFFFFFFNVHISKIPLPMVSQFFFGHPSGRVCFM